MPPRVLLASLGAATAQDYPNRPITVVVPFPAGGPTDAIIRNLGERMRVSLGQPLVVEYATGAGGTVGTARVARAAPDGYTIICGHFGTHATNGAVYSLPFDLVKDFAPISLLPSNPYLIVVNKDLPVNNLREFLAYLKANPDKVNMGHPGVGTGPHLLAVLLADLAGSRMNYVPYRGAAPAMVDLLSGQINLMVDQVQNSMVHVRAGSIKALAIASPQPRRPGRRCPDRGRSRRAGAAHVAVVRLLGAGRNARAGHRQAQRRGGRCARRSGGARAA